MTKEPMTMEEEYKNAEVPMPRGPNDLEEIIQVLETRNKYLHKHVEKLTEEIQCTQRRQCYVSKANR